MLLLLYSSYYLASRTPTPHSRLLQKRAPSVAKTQYGFDLKKLSQISQFDVVCSEMKIIDQEEFYSI